MRFSLTPRTSEFFALFGKAGANALEISRLVERRFREHPSSGVTQEQVKAVETAGDALTRELITLLNTQYMTPFDREDIYQLATEIDDVVDYLEEASDAPRPVRRRDADPARRRAVPDHRPGLRAAGDRLRQPQGHARRPGGARELKRLEDEGDRVLRDAVASLFRGERDRPADRHPLEGHLRGARARVSTPARRPPT